MAALDFAVEARWSGVKSRVETVESRAGGGGITEGSDVVIAGL